MKILIDLNECVNLNSNNYSDDTFGILEELQDTIDAAFASDFVYSNSEDNIFCSGMSFELLEKLHDESEKAFVYECALPETRLEEVIEQASDKIEKIKKESLEDYELQSLKKIEDIIEQHDDIEKEIIKKRSGKNGSKKSKS